MQEYILQRRENSAIKPCFALIEISLAPPLPEEVFGDADIQQMFDACLDMVWISNVRCYTLHQLVSKFN